MGLIAGWATGKIMKGSGYGALMDIVLGIVGGIVGGWIMSMLGFYTSGGLIPSIVVAILGVSRLSWNWRKRSFAKIAERTYEKRAQALHRRRESSHPEATPLRQGPSFRFV